MSTPTERPILMSAPMVRAILDGTKTQTRRVLKPDGKYRLDLVAPADGGPSRCPYGQPGDMLWLREAWRTTREVDFLPGSQLDGTYRLWYEADAPHQLGFGRYRHARFMPRWASRITLEVKDVRVQRLQDISEEDAIAEGLRRVGGPLGSTMWEYSDTTGGQFVAPRVAYSMLWDTIHGPGSWDANPWVWAVTFRKVKP